MSEPDTLIATDTRRTPARRMGPPGAPTWHAILDGAEDILRDEGYASLNAKRIAERIGIKRQLVYYYFCDIDDLYIQLFHRIADKALDRLRQALDSERPLGETWHIGIETFDPTLVWEFMALSSRNEPVRKAMLDYSETARAIQLAAMEKAFGDRPLPRIEVPLPALAMMATWLALGLQREALVGMSTGHQEVRGLIEAFLAGAGQPRP